MEKPGIPLDSSSTREGTPRSRRSRVVIQRIGRRRTGAAGRDRPGNFPGANEDVIDIAYEDHRAVKTHVEKLKILHPTDPEFIAGMEELKDPVVELVAEEEEVLFTEATLNLDTKRLGEQMQARK